MRPTRTLMVGLLAVLFLPVGFGGYLAGQHYQEQQLAGTRPCTFTYAVVDDLVMANQPASPARTAVWRQAVRDAFDTWSQAMAVRDNLRVTFTEAPAPSVTDLQWDSSTTDVYPQAPAGVDVLVTATAGYTQDVLAVPGLRSNPRMTYEAGEFTLAVAYGTTDTGASITVPAPTAPSPEGLSGGPWLLPPLGGPYANGYDAAVLVHEVGHALGVPHSDNSDSVMAAAMRFTGHVTVDGHDLDVLKERFGHCHEPAASWQWVAKSTDYTLETVRDGDVAACLLHATTTYGVELRKTRLAGVSTGACRLPGWSTTVMESPRERDAWLAGAMTGPEQADSQG